MILRRLMYTDPSLRFPAKYTLTINFLRLSRARPYFYFSLNAATPGNTCHPNVNLSFSEY
jgi:hypothetical protein